MPTDNKAIPVLEIGLLVLLGILWGMPYALTKIALTTIPPITMVAERVALAAGTLWAIVLVKGCKIPLERDIAQRLFIQGLLGCVIPYTLITFGQQSVGSALASILNSTGPLFLCLISFMFAGQEPLTARQLFGITIGLGGVVMITGSSALAGFGAGTIGQLAILGATLSSAIGAIHARRFTSIAPEVVAAGTLTFATFLLIPLSFVVESPFNADSFRGSARGYGHKRDHIYCSWICDLLPTYPNTRQHRHYKCWLSEAGNRGLDRLLSPWRATDMVNECRSHRYFDWRRRDQLEAQESSSSIRASAETEMCRRVQSQPLALTN